MSVRNNILDKAKSIINGERQGTYGSAENSFSTIADLWSGYLHIEITPSDVSNMMILMKVARNSSGVYKDDNWIDICGYAALGAEVQEIKKESTATIDHGEGESHLIRSPKPLEESQYEGIVKL